MALRNDENVLAALAAVGLAGVALWTQNAGAFLAYFGTMSFLGAAVHTIAKRLETLISQSATQ